VYCLRAKNAATLAATLQQSLCAGQRIFAAVPARFLLKKVGQGDFNVIDLSESELW
jgi:hypothetical protein